MIVRVLSTLNPAVSVPDDQLAAGVRADNGSGGAGHQLAVGVRGDTGPAVPDDQPG
jgi:hypothetical protein